MLPPFSGSIAFDGQPLEKSGVGIAYLSHRNSIPVGLTVMQTMRFFGKIENVPEEVVKQVIEDFDLGDIVNKSVTALSQGQRKRVSLAKSLIGDKPVKILDEPTANLDPKISAEIRERITAQSRDSIVLYSSHNLYEATDIGNEVIALNEGKVVYSGEMSGLSTGSYRIGIRGKGIEGVVQDYTVEGKYYVFNLRSPSEAADLISRLSAAGAQIYEVKDISNPLERFFDDSS
jgi:ABC-2 type transport system ATP-binding protein